MKAPVSFPALSKFIAASGKAVAWLTVAMVLLTFTIVVLRYGFNLGWIWLQESLTYLHVAVFSVVAAWALQQDGHVRVDIFYAGMTHRNRARVDLRIEGKAFPPERILEKERVPNSCFRRVLKDTRKAGANECEMQSGLNNEI